MATYLDGNVRKATANTVRAMQRSAESRRCPQCQRKSAMVRFSESTCFGSACRWCGHARAWNRETGQEMSP
jgi:Zn ribbon nucleic-acid-binding protein